ncbi:PKD domain-containing protein [Natrialbaceae archaeon A-CW1-1]
MQIAGENGNFGLGDFSTRSRFLIVVTLLIVVVTAGVWFGIGGISDDPSQEIPDSGVESNIDDEADGEREQTGGQEGDDSDDEVDGEDDESDDSDDRSEEDQDDESDDSDDRSEEDQDDSDDDRPEEDQEDEESDSKDDPYGGFPGFGSGDGEGDSEPSQKADVAQQGLNTYQFSTTDITSDKSVIAELPPTERTTIDGVHLQSVDIKPASETTVDGTISQVANRPQDVPSLETDKYEQALFTIDESINNDLIDRVSFEFTVDPDLVDDPDNVTLYRYSGEWEALNTTQTDEGYVYQAESPGFSVFSVRTDRQWADRSPTERGSIELELTNTADGDAGGYYENFNLKVDVDGDDLHGSELRTWIGTTELPTHPLGSDDTTVIPVGWQSLTYLDTGQHDIRVELWAYPDENATEREFVDVAESSVRFESGAVAHDDFEKSLSLERYDPYRQYGLNADWWNERAEESADVAAGVVNDHINSHLDVETEVEGRVRGHVVDRYVDRFGNRETKTAYRTSKRAFNHYNKMGDVVSAATFVVFYANAVQNYEVAYHMDESAEYDAIHEHMGALDQNAAELESAFAAEDQELIDELLTERREHLSELNTAIPQYTDDAYQSVTADGGYFELRAYRFIRGGSSALRNEVLIDYMITSEYQDGSVQSIETESNMPTHGWERKTLEWQGLDCISSSIREEPFDCVTGATSVVFDTMSHYEDYTVYEFEVTNESGEIEAVGDFVDKYDMFVTEDQPFDVDSATGESLDYGTRHDIPVRSIDIDDPGTYYLVVRSGGASGEYSIQGTQEIDSQTTSLPIRIIQRYGPSVQRPEADLVEHPHKVELEESGGYVVYGSNDSRVDLVWEVWDDSTHPDDLGYRYRVDSGDGFSKPSNWEATGDGQIPLSFDFDDGVHRVQIEVRDEIGNQAARNADVVVTSEKFQTVVTTDGQATSNYVFVKVMPDQRTETIELEYRLTGSEEWNEWKTITDETDVGTLEFPYAGEHEIRARSKGVGGEEGDWDTTTIRYTGSPSVSLSTAPNYVSTGPRWWHQERMTNDEQVTLEWSVSSMLWDEDELEYRIQENDGSAWSGWRSVTGDEVEYTFEPDEGAYTTSIEVRNPAEESTSRSVDYVVDRTAPTVDITALDDSGGTQLYGVTSESLGRLEVDARPTGAENWTRIGTGSYFRQGEFERRDRVNDTGEYDIRVRGIDYVGNVGDWDEDEFNSLSVVSESIDQETNGSHSVSVNRASRAEFDGEWIDGEGLLLIYAVLSDGTSVTIETIEVEETGNQTWAADLPGELVDDVEEVGIQVEDGTAYLESFRAYSSELPEPSVVVDPETPRTGDSAIFSIDDSVYELESIESVVWDFTSDGSVDSTGIEVPYTFEESGNQTITVTVSDVFDREESVTTTIHVEESPIDDEPYEVEIIGDESIAVDQMSVFGADVQGVEPDNIETYDWDMGDGTQYSAEEVTHTYDDSGQYKIVIETTTIDGETAIDTLLVDVRPTERTVSDGDRLQEVVDETKQGDTIYIESASYEATTFDVEALTVVGVGDEVLIDRAVISASDVSLENVAVTNGIEIRQFTDNVYIDTVDVNSPETGIHVGEYSSVRVADSTIDAGADGIVFEGQAGGILEDGTITAGTDSNALDVTLSTEFTIAGYLQVNQGGNVVSAATQGAEPGETIRLREGEIQFEEAGYVISIPTGYYDDQDRLDLLGEDYTLTADDNVTLPQIELLGDGITLYDLNYEEPPFHIEIDGDASIDTDNPGEYVAVVEERDSETITYEWEMGDGTTYTGQAITHLYEDAGEYLIDLTASDVDGNTSTAVFWVDVRSTTANVTASDDLQSVIDSARAGDTIYVEEGSHSGVEFNTTNITVVGTGDAEIGASTVSADGVDLRKLNFTGTLGIDDETKDVRITEPFVTSSDDGISVGDGAELVMTNGTVSAEADAIDIGRDVNLELRGTITIEQGTNAVGTASQATTQGDLLQLTPDQIVTEDTNFAIVVPDQYYENHRIQLEGSSYTLTSEPGLVQSGLDVNGDEVIIRDVEIHADESWAITLHGEEIQLTDVEITGEYGVLVDSEENGAVTVQNATIDADTEGIRVTKLSEAHIDESRIIADNGVIFEEDTTGSLTNSEIFVTERALDISSDAEVQTANNYIAEGDDEIVTTATEAADPGDTIRLEEERVVNQDSGSEIAVSPGYYDAQNEITLAGAGYTIEAADEVNLPTLIFDGENITVDGVTIDEGDSRALQVENDEIEVANSTIIGTIAVNNGDLRLSNSTVETDAATAVEVATNEEFVLRDSILTHTGSGDAITTYRGFVTVENSTIVNEEGWALEGTGWGSGSESRTFGIELINTTIESDRGISYGAHRHEGRSLITNSTFNGTQPFAIEGFNGYEQGAIFDGENSVTQEVDESLLSPFIAGAPVGTQITVGEDVLISETNNALLHHQDGSEIESLGSITRDTILQGLEDDPLSISGDVMINNNAEVELGHIELNGSVTVNRGLLSVHNSSITTEEGHAVDVGSNQEFILQDSTLTHTGSGDGITTYRGFVTVENSTIVNEEGWALEGTGWGSGSESRTFGIELFDTTIESAQGVSYGAHRHEGRSLITNSTFNSTLPFAVDGFNGYEQGAIFEGDNYVTKATDESLLSPFIAGSPEGTEVSVGEDVLVSETNNATLHHQDGSEIESLGTITRDTILQGLEYDPLSISSDVMIDNNAEVKLGHVELNGSVTVNRGQLTMHNGSITTEDGHAVDVGSNQEFILQDSSVHHTGSDDAITTYRGFITIENSEIVNEEGWALEGTGWGSGSESRTFGIELIDTTVHSEKGTFFGAHRHEGRSLITNSTFNSTQPFTIEGFNGFEQGAIFEGANYVTKATGESLVSAFVAGSPKQSKVTVGENILINEENNASLHHQDGSEIESLGTITRDTILQGTEDDRLSISSNVVIDNNAEVELGHVELNGSVTINRGHLTMHNSSIATEDGHAVDVGSNQEFILQDSTLTHTGSGDAITTYRGFITIENSEIVNVEGWAFEGTGWGSGSESRTFGIELINTTIESDRGVSYGAHRHEGRSLITNSTLNSTQPFAIEGFNGYEQGAIFEGDNYVTKATDESLLSPFIAGSPEGTEITVGNDVLISETNNATLSHYNGEVINSPGMITRDSVFGGDEDNPVEISGDLGITNGADVELGYVKFNGSVTVDSGSIFVHNSSLESDEAHAVDVDRNGKFDLRDSSLQHTGNDDAITTHRGFVTIEGSEIVNEEGWALEGTGWRSGSESRTFGIELIDTTIESAQGVSYGANRHEGRSLVANSTFNSTQPFAIEGYDGYERGTVFEGDNYVTQPTSESVLSEFVAGSSEQTVITTGEGVIVNEVTDARLSHRNGETIEHDVEIRSGGITFEDLDLVGGIHIKSGDLTVQNSSIANEAGHAVDVGRDGGFELVNSTLTDTSDKDAITTHRGFVTVENSTIVNEEGWALDGTGWRSGSESRTFGIELIDTTIESDRGISYGAHRHEGRSLITNSTFNSTQPFAIEGYDGYERGTVFEGNNYITQPTNESILSEFVAGSSEQTIITTGKDVIVNEVMDATLSHRNGETIEHDVEIRSGGTVIFENLTLTNSIYVESGDLTIRNSSIVNDAGHAVDVGRDGGFTLVNSTLTDISDVDAITTYRGFVTIDDSEIVNEEGWALEGTGWRSGSESRTFGIELINTTIESDQGVSYGAHRHEGRSLVIDSTLNSTQPFAIEGFNGYEQGAIFEGDNYVTQATSESLLSEFVAGSPDGTEIITREDVFVNEANSARLFHKNNETINHDVEIRSGETVTFESLNLTSSIYVTSGDLTIRNSSIENDADHAVDVGRNGEFTLVNSTFVDTSDTDAITTYRGFVTVKDSKIINEEGWALEGTGWRSGSESRTFGIELINTTIESDQGVSYGAHRHEGRSLIGNSTFNSTQPFAIESFNGYEQATIFEEDNYVSQRTNVSLLSAFVAGSPEGGEITVHDNKLTSETNNVTLYHKDGKEIDTVEELSRAVTISGSATDPVVITDTVEVTGAVTFEHVEVNVSATDDPGIVVKGDDFELQESTVTAGQGIYVDWRVEDVEISGSDIVSTDDAIIFDERSTGVITNSNIQSADGFAVITRSGSSGIISDNTLSGGMESNGEWQLENNDIE